MSDPPKDCPDTESESTGAEVVKPKVVKPYNYFDTPDGEDTLKKLWFVLKPTFFVGLGVSTADVILLSHPKGYLQTIGRYVYISTPILAAATTFVVTTNVVTNIRKKSDALNWFIGGFAAGSIFGIWRKNMYAGIVVGTACGLTAVAKKLAVDSGYVFMPDTLPRVGGHLSGQFDWTLTKERPKNWVRVAPSVVEEEAPKT